MKINPKIVIDATKHPKASKAAQKVIMGAEKARPKVKRYAKATAAGAAVAGAASTAAYGYKNQSAAAHQKKAKRADSVAAVAGTGALVGGVGGFATRKVLPHSPFAKKRGIVPVLAGATTGASLVAARHVYKRDKAAGTPATVPGPGLGRRANTTMAAAGLGTDTSMYTAGARVGNKGLSQNKGRSVPKGY